MEQEERFTRMENIVEKLVDRTNRLAEVMLLLAESHIKLANRMDTFTERVDVLTARMDTFTERMDRMAEESVERDRRLGERIESLVSAIGEFIRNRPTTG
jgi:DNA anti-recombination protein RmuC